MLWMPLRLTLDALQVLDAIDRCGSFAGGAAALHRVPSALTYTVHKLEEDLGVAVFDRSGHRARLTPAGRELLDEGRRLLDAAGELECRVQRLATGWETELRIAVDGLLVAEALLPAIADFYAGHAGTRLRLMREVLGGAWDALASGRADLAIGASLEAHSGGGFATRAFSEEAFVFAVAPSHPLAAMPDPLAPEVVAAYRAVAVGDTSRRLPARSSGILSGQDVLVVPDLPTKIAAQAAGLGVGYLPLAQALPWLSSRRLVAKTVAGGRPAVRTVIAWPAKARGKALSWFLRRLEDPALRDALLGGGVPGEPESKPPRARAIRASGVRQPRGAGRPER
jgi:DNA-binding transcriptional LysR family regulator